MTLKEIQETCCGEVYEIEEFIRDVNNRRLIDYDGWGSPHDGEKELDELDALDMAKRHPDELRKYLFGVQI